MNIHNVWSNEGIFTSDQGHLAPEGIRSRITVPSLRTRWESAAMVELAARIGLHLTNLPLPVFDHLFVLDQLDSSVVPSSKAGPTNKCHVVLGYEWGWLVEMLGERVDPLRQVRTEAQQESGILFLCKDQEETILVITGTSPEMTLHAARALVTEEMEGAISKDSVVILIPQERAASHRVSTKPAGVNYSLHDLFTTEGLYQKKEGELLSTLDVVMDMNDAGSNETVASVEMAARLALSAGYVCFPLTNCMGEENRANRFMIAIHSDPTKNEHPGSGLAWIEGTHTLRLQSHPTTLVSFVREFTADCFAPLDELQRNGWRHRFAALKCSSPDINLRAQLGLQAFMRKQPGKAGQLHIPEHLAYPAQLWHDYLDTNRDGDPISLVVREETPLWTAEWINSGELAEMEAYLHSSLEAWKRSDQVQQDVQVEVTTTCSEPTFDAWTKSMKASIQKQWGIRARFVYRDANKSGLNWAMQEVLPRIKQLPGIESVQLGAKAFRPSEKHLDLAHRFLQELYPFDSILSAEIKLPLDAIHLQLMEEPTAPMFSVIASDKDGRELASWSWEGWVESLPYMPEQPRRGHVMIPCAGIRIYQEGTENEWASKSFQTNPYRFWNWYQQDVLPQVLSLVGSNPGVPKFSRLECHVGMDAVEKKLPHLEENSSVLEALHEDIYFYTLHAMHDHGKKTGDPEWDAPGGIVPFMHVEPGAAPWARVALYAFPTEHQVTLRYDNHEVEILKTVPCERFQEARVVGLSRQGQQWSFTIEGLSDQGLQESCEKWLAASAQSHSPEQSVSQFSSQAIAEKSVMEDVFVNEDTRQWLEARRERIPGQVTAIDFSLNGRWIWMVELFEQGNDPKRVSSLEKHGLYKPTFFINARHHANEVSSTNAALQLIDQLMAEPSVLQSVNLVLIPLENADGAALHAQMAEENPCWKLHAARYNACGLEFAKYRFQKGVPFGESRVYPKVWQRWAPDIVLDDHGIPSHEWIQPFSGYNSPPRFPVSYWIPSARMYTIWRELTDATAQQREAYSSLRSFLTARLDADKEVASDNRQWLDTYRRWGNDFDQRRFPIELSNGSIAYTRQSPVNEESHDLIERFPQWVTADLMTEVNDETVYGKELGACRHAHHVVHQAIIDWMKERKVQLQVCREQRENGTTRIGLERIRPL